MTRHELGEAKNIKAEIEAIQQSLTHPKSVYVSAFYKDYSSGKGIPRTEDGEDGGRSERIQLEGRLLRKRKALEKAIAKCQAFIDEIDDAEMRSILQYYYIVGITQHEIAKAMHLEQSSVSKKLTRFWNKLEK